MGSDWEAGGDILRLGGAPGEDGAEGGALVEEPREVAVRGVQHEAGAGAAGGGSRGGGGWSPLEGRVRIYFCDRPPRLLLPYPGIVHKTLKQLHKWAGAAGGGHEGQGAKGGWTPPPA